MENAITAVCAACFVALVLLVNWIRLQGIGRVWYSPIGWPLRALLSLTGGVDNWQFRHAIISPFGVVATTFLVTHFASENYRPVHRHLDDAKDFIDASALIYGMSAVLMELIGGRVVFWALEQWKKGKEAYEAEARERQEAYEAEARERQEALEAEVQERQEAIIAEVRENVLSEIRGSALLGISENASARGWASAVTEMRHRAAELPNYEQFISLLDEMDNGEYRVDPDGTVWRRMEHTGGNVSEGL